MRVLVVEDDQGVGELVSDDLREQGYALDWVQDGEEAVELLASFPYDLVVLDLMLPGYNGFEILERLRGGNNRVPVLMLTARDGVGDRVKGLELGADDYLTKPFHLTELRARVRALLRRSQGEASNQVSVGRLVLEVAQKRVWFDDKEVRLSGKEYTVLEFLALNAGGYYTRDALLEHVWPGDASIDPRTVDTYIRYLRRKLGDDTIETVRGLGYRFRG